MPVWLLLACLHDQNKSGFFWRAPGFFSVNQGFLKTFQIVLIGWIKAGPPKSHFCYMYLLVIKIFVTCSFK